MLMYMLFLIQIPLGVKLKNEAKYEDMIEIMTDLHYYVPTKTSTFSTTVDDANCTVVEESLYPVVFGGDQNCQYQGIGVV